MAFALTIIDNAKHGATVSNREIARAGEAGEVMTVVVPAGVRALGNDAYIDFLLPDGQAIYKGAYDCSTGTFTVTLGVADEVLSYEGKLVMQFRLINGTSIVWLSEEINLKINGSVNPVTPATPNDALFVNVPTTFPSGHIAGYDDTTHKLIDMGVASGAVNYIVNVKDYGAVGDGVTDDTDAIQAALDDVADMGYGSLYFDGKTYAVDVTGKTNASLNLPDNINIIFQPLTKILQKATMATTYNVFYANAKQNIEIFGNGGTLSAGKLSHSGTTGEAGMCLNVKNCTNVKVHDLALIDAWGDGLYLGGTSDVSLYNKNLSFDNINIDNCRRNGISIINGKNIFFKNIIISNVAGTAPQFPVDIEANYADAVIENIFFDNVVCYDVLAGFQIMKNVAIDGIWKNIVVRNSMFPGSNVVKDFSTSGYLENIRFENCLSDMTGLSGYGYEIAGNIHSMFIHGFNISNGTRGINFDVHTTADPVLLSIKDGLITDLTSSNIKIVPFTGGVGHYIIDNVGVGNTAGFTGYSTEPFYVHNITNLIMRNCFAFGDMSMNDTVLLAMNTNMQKSDLGKNLQTNDVRIRKAAGGMFVKTPDGTKVYKISVDDAGNVISTLKTYIYSD